MKLKGSAVVALNQYRERCKREKGENIMDGAQQRKAREKTWRLVLWFGIGDVVLACGYRCAAGLERDGAGQRT
jgi:hypothetical protein